MENMQKTKIKYSNVLHYKLSAAPIKYFYHGWQSWSLCSWLNFNELNTPFPYPSITQPMFIDPAFNGGPFPDSHDFIAVMFPDGSYVLIGSLRIGAHHVLITDKDGSTITSSVKGTTDPNPWFIGTCNNDRIDKLMHKYAKCLKNNIKFIRPYVFPTHPRIWCSWYSFYEKINQKSLLTSIDDIDQFNFDVIQIDDGWQKKVGDWSENEKFPDGMKLLADKITAKGKVAGIWLAPLIAVSSSQLFKYNPHWFLQGINGGFNWGEEIHCLDLRQDEVKSFIKTVLRKLYDDGYRYFKLDFLYAGALKGEFREIIYRDAMEEIVLSLPHDAFIVACGAPIFASLSFCNSLRIGPDVAKLWENSFHTKFLRNFSIYGAKNGLRTSINRYWVDDIVHADPDVVYFQTQGNKLTIDEKRLLLLMSKLYNCKSTSALIEELTTAESADLNTYLHESTDNVGKVKQIGQFKYSIGGDNVDFESHIDLPSPPRCLHKLILRCIEGLTSIRPLFKLVVKLQRKFSR